jgi:signal transduction histidine kinase
MTLGLPDHVARAASATALSAAAHAAGLCALCLAVANVVIAATSVADPTYFLSFLAIVPMGVLIVVLTRRRTTATTIAYLVAGSLGTYFYSATLLGQTPSYHDTSLFVFALPVVAMSLVGGAGSGALVGVLWCSLGFGLAETMVWAAAAAAGRTYTPNAISLCAYLFAVAVLLFEALSRRGRRRPQSAIYRAAKATQLFRVRQELAVASAAELHDTTLSELIAISNSTPGPLRPALRTRIEADLTALGRDRAEELLRSGAPDSNIDWLESELHTAIDIVREEGLTVEVSGDLRALERVSEERRRALALAVRQCLMNVLRHSGASSAEVAVSASGGELTVLVVDSGHGFIESATQPDRLGLRHSVRDRIERVGGDVTVWSSPEVGTTIMLVVPCAEVGAGDEEFAS